MTTGSVAGGIFDPAGRAVPGATIRAVDSGHSVSRMATSGQSGEYRFMDLPPAAYTISAAAPGLEEASAEVVVAVDSHVRLNLQLAVAGRKESVQVIASGRPVQADSAELGMVLDQKKLDSLPLNRRDFLQLAFLTPGVAPPVEDSELSQYGSFAMHANGAREASNNFLLDGTDNNDPYVNRYVLQPSVDAIQEYKIATNSYSAEYGRSPGGQVNVITRSGSNAYHGFLYEYLRNSVLDARNFFDGAEKPKFIRNQFGAGVGGPLIRNRLFFFASSDFLRERRSITRVGSVPTNAERAGDLSAARTPPVDPFTRIPFPGGLIPATRISPVSRHVLELFPLPNRASGVGNHLAQPTLQEARTQANFRVDYSLTAKDQLAVRYSYGFLDLFEPFGEDTDAIPGFGDSVNDPGHNAMIHWHRTIGPTVMNSLQVGFSRLSRELLPQNHSTDVNSLWGVSWLPAQARSYGYPVFNVAGYSKVGDATSLPILRHANTYQIVEGLSVLRGNHLLKAGGEVRRMQLNSVLDLLSRGSLSFSGAISGSGISDLLLGFPSFGLQSRSDNPMALRSTAYGAYFQDDWKVSPSLTLNLGVRYEYNTPPVDPQDRMTTLNLATGTVAQVGTNGLSRAGYQADGNNIAPRVGLAWSPKQNLVVRAGYGVYYDSAMFVVSTSQYFNPPQFNLKVYFPSAAGLLTLDNPFPSKGGYTPPPSLNMLDPGLTGSYMQHWNFSVERAFGSGSTINLSYGGSKGTHLIRSRDLNQPPPGPGDLQARRPYGKFGNILLVESGANSGYHSLQAVFNRSMTRSASVWAVYTFSKSMDDTSAFLGVKPDRNFPQDSRNFHAERGLSSFDMTHRALAAYVYRLPRFSRWTRNTEVRGIATVQSGQPFTPVLRFDNSNTGNGGGNFGFDRPDLLRSPSLAAPGPDLWFDTGAFRVPAPYTFGSAGRNIIRGPGYASFDVSLVRDFPIREWGRLSFEAQAFNLFNHSNFSLPELYADEPATFGRVFSAKAPRQLQFALRLNF